MNNYEHLKNDKNFSIVDFEHADFILGQTGEATTLAKIRQLFPNILIFGRHSIITIKMIMAKLI